LLILIWLRNPIFNEEWKKGTYDKGERDNGGGDWRQGMNGGRMATVGTTY